MIKHAKEIRIAIDGRPYRSHKAPESIDEWDGSCPACGSKRFAEVLTIIQHGFEQDDCVTLVDCEECYEVFHYYYQVEAAAMDTLVRTAFDPPTGGSNNIEHLGQ